MTNDQVVKVEFRDGSVYLHLADGRVIGNSLEWHPWLQQASDAARQNVEMYEMSVYFPDLDDGLDVQEMLKGAPPHLRHRQVSKT